MSNITFLPKSNARGFPTEDFILLVREGVSDALRKMNAHELQAAFSGKEDASLALVKAA